MTPAHSAFLLKTDNLAGDRGGAPIFAGVNMLLKAGDTIILRGANGAGKTTLLRILAGLAAPSAGTMSLTPPPRDAETTGAAEDPATAADLICYVGHRDGAKAPLSVRDNLLFWRRLYDAAPATVDATITAFDLNALVDRPAGALSAGQRRRLGVARAAVSQRPIWLLDEPTASLDAASATAITAQIAAHCGAGGGAVIATHDPLDLPAARSFHLGAAEARP